MTKPRRSDRTHAERPKLHQSLMALSATVPRLFQPATSILRSAREFAITVSPRPKVGYGWPKVRRSFLRIDLDLSFGQWHLIVESPFRKRFFLTSTLPHQAGQNLEPFRLGSRRPCNPASSLKLLATSDLPVGSAATGTMAQTCADVGSSDLSSSYSLNRHADCLRCYRHISQPRQSQSLRCWPTAMRMQHTAATNPH